MANELKHKTKTLLYFIFCIAAYVILQMLTVKMNRIGAQTFNINGCFMAIQYGLCLMMICREHKKGTVISLVLMGMSMLSIVSAIFRAHNAAPIPGLFNTVFYIITMLLLGNYFNARDKEAVTDFLTGLYNRRGLYALLKKTIENEKPFSVIYVDLGNFKFINDSYGHAYGDRLLKDISKRMRDVIGDSGVLTRIGGDEFVVVLNNNNDPEKIAEQLMEKVREKAGIVVGDSRIDCYLTCYTGIASYPKDTADYEALIKYADIAMYQAAKERSTVPCFFSSEMADGIARQMEIEKLIKEALEHDYFYLVYQPQYMIDGKKLCGFESLLRMKTPEGQFVSPGEFIPVAEKGDLILQIDDYVLRRVMKEFLDIVIGSGKELIVSVNVSAKNIAAPDFPDRINAMLDETGFPPENLEIEITEYCLVQSVDITIDNIKKLRAIGVKVALDDFGTGYTSLNYLAKMPINLLKVDKSLVDDICKNDKSRDFVNAVISMGHLMGCQVISEGVEDEEQLTILSEQNCDLVQGYVWGRPLEYSAARELSAG